MASPAHLLCRSCSFPSSALLDDIEGTLRFAYAGKRDIKRERVCWSERAKKQRAVRKHRQRSSARAEQKLRLFHLHVSDNSLKLHCDLTTAILSLFSPPASTPFPLFHQFCYSLKGGSGINLFQSEDEDTDSQSLYFGGLCIVIFSSNYTALPRVSQTVELGCFSHRYEIEIDCLQVINILCCPY